MKPSDFSPYNDLPSCTGPVLSSATNVVLYLKAFCAQNRILYEWFHGGCVANHIQTKQTSPEGTLNTNIPPVVHEHSDVKN